MAKPKPMSETPEYWAWRELRARCRHPGHQAYRYYGGRGITVCPEWEDFTVFLHDMGQRPSSGHSIDRIDNDGPYSPANCRWATNTEQNRNKRGLRLLTVDGRTMSVTEWAEETGIARHNLYYRLDKGWPIKDVLDNRKHKKGSRG